MRRNAILKSNSAVAVLFVNVCHLFFNLYYTVTNETFQKCFQNIFVPVLDLVSKNAIFGKLKALSARGYMSHTLVLEHLLAAKWSRYPWSTGLASWGCRYTHRHVCPYMGMGFTQGNALIKHF